MGTRDGRLAEVAQRLRAAGCVFAEDEAALLLQQAGSEGELAGMVDRRTSGEPLEHVLGWASFWGLRIEVGPGDMASLPGGVPTTWTLTTPFRELWVFSAADR